MDWVLILIWTSTYVTTSETVPFQSKLLCEGAADRIMREWSPPPGRQDTTLKAMCVQAARAPNAQQ